MRTTFVVVVLTLVVEIFISRWDRTRCRCGRSFGLWLSAVHCRHAVLVTNAWVVTAGTISATITQNRVFAVIDAAAAVWAWYIVKLHKSGRRKWPDRVLGRIKVHSSGRLVVVKE